MNIAVLMTSDDHEEILQNNFVFQCIAHATTQFSDLQFFVFSNHDFSYFPHQQESNFKFINTRLSSGNVLSSALFSLIELPLLINKYKIDVFISNQAAFPISKKTIQIAVLQDIMHIPSSRLQKITKYANQIIVHNEIDCIAASSVFNNQQVKMLPFGASEELVPLALSVQEEVKKKVTNGNDYFLLDSSYMTDEDIVITLKAFSIFKKWHRSAMQLVILIDKKKIQNTQTLLANYVYRDAVVLSAINHNDLQDDLLCSAYAVLYFSDHVNQIGKIMNALKMGIPILIPESPFFRAHFNDCASFFTKNKDDIYKKWSLLYKDEVLKNQLSAEGLSKSSAADWSTIAPQFLALISA